MKEITIEITKFCPHYCKYCSTDASPAKTHLSLGEILVFLDNNKDATRINISGGEPLSHPDFWAILQKCNSITDDVWVYTNALKQIRYNTDVVKEITVEANVCMVAGKDSYIPMNADKVHLLKFIRQGRGEYLPEQPEVVVSHNFDTDDCEHDCDNCNHIYLNSDGKVTMSPCMKYNSLP